MDILAGVFEVYDIYIVSIRDRYIPFTRRGKGGVGFSYLPSKSWIELGPLVIVDYLAEGCRLPFRVQARRLGREGGSEVIQCIFE